MPIIPEKAYAQVESRLKDRWTLLPRAQAALMMARQAALSPPGQATDGDRARPSQPGDRTQRAAIKLLEAEKRLDEAEKWVEVFRMLDRAFPWETTAEGVAAGYLYGNGMTQDECCRAMRCSRARLRQLRDNYVGHAALFAADKGLLRIKEG